jgi:hypothetical protein
MASFKMFWGDVPSVDQLTSKKTHYADDLLKKNSCPYSRITSSKIFHAVRAGFSCSESKKTGNLVRNLK